MCLIIKLSIAILILYLKINGLNAIPLIERHKSSLSALTLFTKPTNTIETTNLNTTNTNKNTKIFNYKSLNTKTTIKTTTTNRTNALKINPNTGYTVAIATTANNVDNHKLISIDKRFIDNKTKKSYYYNVSVSDNNNKIYNNNNYKSFQAGNIFSNPKTTPSIPALSDENSSKNNENVDSELDLSNILLNNFHNSDVQQIFLKYESDAGNACFLDALKKNLMWWSNQDGSLREEAILNITKRHSFLDLSFRNISKDDYLYMTTRSHTHGQDIIIFSAAQNNLTRAPYRTLLLLNSTLKYLTLKGNQFAVHKAGMQMDGNKDSNIITTLNFNGQSDENHRRSNRWRYKQYKRKTEEGIGWATFPLMSALTELDISNCQIEFVARHAFRNLTNLRRLFIAHNKMLTIPHDTFRYVSSLQYLDLSFTNVLDSDYKIPLPTFEAIYNLIYGVKIQQTTFRHLPELVYLDLSHTKLTRNSAVAFTHLSDKLRYMSLCYTAFPMVGNGMFKNTALVGLDLSGNAYAAYNMIEDAFEGVADTLRYLYFEHSNIKDLTWLKYLYQLRVLGLAGNNINSLSLEIFKPLTNLQLLDLSSNHIGNWYNRVFTQNEQLRVLTLRDNNINIITSEMLRDFQLLDYLSLGYNNFVCDCLLRDLVDIAAANNKDAECFNNVLQEAQEILTDNAYLVDYLSTNITSQVKRGYHLVRSAVSINSNGEIIVKYDVAKLLMQRYSNPLESSYKNIERIQHHRPKIRFVSQFYRMINDFSTAGHCDESEPILLHDKLNSSMLKFQLLDYEEEHYWCFNETERMHFMQLNCQHRNYVEDLTHQLHTLTKYVVSSVGSVVGVLLIGVLCYFKRWHIHYYFSYMKSAALVSVAAKDHADQLNAFAESDPNLVYDIFISYCESDRQWVVEELLPNVEESGDVSICMHERDFQIGLTILDNIVSCMDRSRALMLIISNHFLLSHWCQFEMHLAQHRIFEVSKEHLILVFLEDIPRNKRPKTLQYLMEVKTYIKWPNTGKNGERTPSAEERKFFWKRLKRSLENIGLNPYPSPGESHV